MHISERQEESCSMKCCLKVSLHLLRDLALKRVFDMLKVLDVCSVLVPK